VVFIPRWYRVGGKQKEEEKLKKKKRKNKNKNKNFPRPSRAKIQKVSAQLWPTFFFSVVHAVFECPLLNPEVLRPQLVLYAHTCT
jgi:mannosyltransferase OCH1-like enzyme